MKLTCIRVILSCINEDNMTCPYSAASCTSPFKFSYSTRGLLLRDNSRETYWTEKTGTIRKVSFTNHSTAMIQWNNVVNIFVSQELLIENPGLDYASFTTVADYNVTLDTEVLFPIDSLNITTAYKTFYENRKITPLKSLETITNNSTNIKALIATICVLFITTIIFAIVLHLKQRRTYQKPPKTHYHYRTLPDFEFDLGQRRRTRHASY